MMCHRKSDSIAGFKPFRVLVSGLLCKCFFLKNLILILDVSFHIRAFFTFLVYKMFESVFDETFHFCYKIRYGICNPTILLQALQTTNCGNA